MRIFDKFRQYVKQLNDFEDNISENRRELQAVYERNQILEKEIIERTAQLNQANKALLTLQHIWDMMNSSTPLSNALDKIVESLHGEFGYLFGAIVEKVENDSEKYFLTSAYTKCPFFDAMKHYFKTDVEGVKLLCPEDGILMNSLKNGEVLSTQEISKFIKSILPEVRENRLNPIIEGSKARSLIVLPLRPELKQFGCMLVFSPRAEVLEDELSFLQLFAHQMELAITIADLFEKVRKQAITDPLTELFNRRYFEEAMQREAERSERMSQPFTLISLDLDYLKQINDKYGHNYGDIAIRTIGKVLKRNARSIDIPARIGGEEFNVLLPGIDSNGGMIAAERIRAAIEAEKIEKVGTITASIGVATYIEHSKSLDELLEMADQAMYRAKVNGRNRVVIAKEGERDSWQKIAIDAFMDILSKQRIPVSKALSEEIRSKLERVTTSGATLKEILYSVSDTIAQTYDPVHQEGATKQKIYLAVKLAKCLNLSKEEQDNLKLAMLLYDIGNTMIPDEIFKNPNKLNAAEQNFVQKHPVIAAREILQPISSVSDIIPIIEHHHENWDGSGYPNKIKGEDIPASSQIVLLIDSYTAMIKPRSYRPALTKAEAIATIKSGAGKKWSEDIVAQFVEMIKDEK